MSIQLLLLHQKSNASFFTVNHSDSATSSSSLSVTHSNHIHHKLLAKSAWYSLSLKLLMTRWLFALLIMDEASLMRHERYYLILFAVQKKVVSALVYSL